MWKRSEIESGDQNIRFGIENAERQLSNRDFLENLSNSEEFRMFYNDILSDCGFQALFWEHPPFTEDNLDHSYECNLINSTFLAGRNPDPDTFEAYFRSDKTVVRFPNLGNDAILIAPCPVLNHSVYTHIGTFVRNAEEEQINDLWKTTGIETLRTVGSKPKWLSTSGLGVFWLHIRIDQVPKYYQTEAYKKL